MRARTLGYIVAALTPVWLLAILAIEGRFFISPHAFVEYGPETSQKILAYSAVIRYTVLNQQDIEGLDPAALDATFERWMKYDREGLLTDITPIATDDDGTSGFRMEIEGNRRTVINALQRDIRRQLNQGNYPEASRRAEQVLQLASVAKLNSSYASFFGSSCQMNAIETYFAIEPKLPEDSRISFMQTLSQVEADPEAVKRVAMHLVSLSELDRIPGRISMPTRSDFQMMLAKDMTNFDVNGGSSAEGLLLAESYRVAYRCEMRLSEELRRHRLTAFNSRSATKSHLP